MPAMPLLTVSLEGIDLTPWHPTSVLNLQDAPITWIYLSLFRSQDEHKTPINAMADMNIWSFMRYVARSVFSLGKILASL